MAPEHEVREPLSENEQAEDARADHSEECQKAAAAKRPRVLFWIIGSQYHPMAMRDDRGPHDHRHEYESDDVYADLRSCRASGVLEHEAELKMSERRNWWSEVGEPDRN
jgi:hypothetical protein